MILDTAVNHVWDCARQMNERYGRTVFDEWAIVSLSEQKARVLSYVGPRNDLFLRNFASDLGGLRAGLLESKYQTGDFEFARYGVGTGHEAFMVLGNGLYLICNNTDASMNEIAKDPHWLGAQVPFAELAEKFRADPLMVAGDNTRFFRKVP